jgi:hypothetical protein
MKMHFGRKRFGAMFILEFWTNFHPETTVINRG